LLQIASTFAFRVAERVGALFSADLQDATACCTAALFAAPVLVVGVELVAAGVELVAAGVEVLWLLDVELLPPPQPARSAPPASTTTSNVNGVRIVGPPWIAGTFAHGSRAVSRPSNRKPYNDIRQMCGP
jgi:hypothetical protein